MPNDDVELVHRSLNGDPNAFGQLVCRYQHAVYGLALSHTWDFAEAEDLAQEAFVTAYMNLHHLRDPSRFGSWLKTTVVNQCRTWSRSRRAEMNSLEKMERDTPLLGQEQVLPDHALEEADLRHRVIEAISRLPEKNRQAITLYYVDGLSTQEIGSFLGASPAAIDQRLHRARKQLKEEMITMVEDVLKTNYPSQFPEKVLREIAGKAREAREQHIPAEAVRYYDEALHELESLEETEEQKRWKAEMLKERAQASLFLKRDNGKEIIADLEASLRLEEELGNQEKCALLLRELAWRYLKVKSPKATQCFQQAASRFESVGDPSGQAWCLCWMAWQYLPWSLIEKNPADVCFARSLETFQHAVDLFQQVRDRKGEALALASLALLEELGEDPDPDAILPGATCLELERSSSALILKTQPGFGAGREKAPMAALDYMIYPTEWLHFPLEEGQSRSCRTFAYGVEERHAISTIQTLGAVVETVAGRFQDCLELETRFERRGEEDPNERYCRLNLRNSGTRRSWFAPGIGLVKLCYQHGDGMETDVQLEDYTISQVTEDYLPLHLGMTWRYQVTNNTSDLVVRDRCWVATQDGATSYIAACHYSEKV